MKTGHFWALGHVSDQQLRGDLSTLLAGGYRTEARIIAHIAEVEERKLHLHDGSPSLFDYCVNRLHLSESEAFHRITAARIARTYPFVFGLIETRQIHLTAVCLLRDYLTPGNHRKLLEEASHKTKLQVQELLARRFPRPDVNSYVRKLPAAQTARRANGVDGAMRVRASETQPGYELPSAGLAPGVSAAGCVAVAPQAPESSSLRFVPITPDCLAAARARIEPTSEARYRIQLNASSSLKEKLELFQALVSHAIPNGDVAAALERALDLAIGQLEKQRFAKTDHPRAARRFRQLNLKRPTAGREHITNAVQRAIVERDGTRCTFVGENGCRCSARAFLQIHHEQPWARGGDATPENLRLLCSAHNRLLAERDFGAEPISERTFARREAASASTGETVRSLNRDLPVEIRG